MGLWHSCGSYLCRSGAGEERMIIIHDTGYSSRPGTVIQHNCGSQQVEDGGTVDGRRPFHVRWRDWLWLKHRGLLNSTVALIGLSLVRYPPRGTFTEDYMPHPHVYRNKCMVRPAGGLAEAFVCYSWTATRVLFGRAAAFNQPPSLKYPNEREKCQHAQSYLTD